jgi:hypothetical protein
VLTGVIVLLGVFTQVKPIGWKAHPARRGQVLVVVASHVGQHILLLLGGVFRLESGFPRRLQQSFLGKAPIKNIQLSSQLKNSIKRS